MAHLIGRLPQRLYIILFCAAAVFAAPASAQEFPQEKGAARTVQMFRLFCLSQLPDFDGITKAAGFGEFAQIEGQELQSYQPRVPADELRAWRFHDHGVPYVLTAAKSKPDDAMKQHAPKFANSRSVACSLILPESEPHAPLLAELVKTLGRTPDQSWTEGSMQARSWTDERPKILSYIHYFTPTKPRQKGVLSATAFVLD